MLKLMTLTPTQPDGAELEQMRPRIASRGASSVQLNYKVRTAQLPRASNNLAGPVPQTWTDLAAAQTGTSSLGPDSSHRTSGDSRRASLSELHASQLKHTPPEGTPMTTSSANREGRL